MPRKLRVELAGLEPPPDFLDAAGVHDLFCAHPDEAQRAYRALGLSGVERQGSDPAGVRPL